MLFPQIKHIVNTHGHNYTQKLTLQKEHDMWTSQTEMKESRPCSQFNKCKNHQVSVAYKLEPEEI